ncbi:MAG: hypothetical protein NW220_01465 [Leptolyngbyaceae cyanobacterium bins.349]|nr:hypothetical protein [Leptolyngbyaceae cyanobacterium bins.349]
MVSKMLLRSVAIAVLVLTGGAALSTRTVARRPDRRPPPTQKPQPIPGQFDYYMLTLSWSPDYCVGQGKRDPQQCGQGRQLGFVLHGLWPQYTRGYPANCTTEAFDPQMRQQFPNLYPSPRLYAHEWEKHGTCSGLTQAQYHQLAKTLKERVNLPDRYVRPQKPFRLTLATLQHDFVQANPDFATNTIVPSCSGSGRFLQDMRVCFAKDGRAIACSEAVVRRSRTSCGQPNFLVRSVR